MKNRVRVAVIALVGLLVALTSSCAPKVGPSNDSPIVKAPAQSEAVAPRAIVVNERVTTAIETTSKIKSGIDTAVLEADRLRKQKTATEKELDGMWALLTREQTHIKALVGQLDAAKSETVKLQAEALDRDREVSELRRDRQHSDAKLAAVIANEKILLEANKKLAKKASVYDFFRTWIFWILGVGVVLIVIKALISGASRTIKPV